METEEVPKGLVKWLANGERGMSSNTIVYHILGIGKGVHSPPYDVADFRRCRLLLEQVPLLAERFYEMETCYGWGGLVRRWGELSLLMDEESPEWRQGNIKECRRTYALMKRIRAE